MDLILQHVPLALISGEELLNALLYLVIWGVIVGILWWGLNKIKPPEPWFQVGTVILVVLTCIVLINILLGIAGHPFIKW